VQDEGGVWELPIPMEIAKQIAEEDKAKSLDALYAKLDQTEPGSEESDRISEKIIDAIG
jgi:hypothetical protein